MRYFPWRDKGIHFIEYGVLGWLCAVAAFRTWPNHARWRTALFALFVAVLWALSDEIHQAFVPGRSADARDLVADALGATSGVLLHRFFSNKSVS
ncbi:MAG: VanZ family protein [Myxococcota bacterium]